MNRGRPNLPSGSPSRFLLVYGVVGALLFLRSHSAFLWPTMWLEDGHELFDRYRNALDPGVMAHFYAGYVSLLPDFVGWISARLPATVAPSLYAFFSLAVAALALSLPSARRFRVLVASDRARAGVCILLVLLPLGNVMTVSAAMFSLWHLLLILILLCLVPLPRSGAGRGLQLGGMLLCAWSHPLSIAVIPIALIRIVRPPGPSDRGFFALLLLLGVPYYALGVDSQGRTLTDLVRAVPDALLIFPERVMLEGALGIRVRDHLTVIDFALLSRVLGAAIFALVVSIHLLAWRRLPARTRRGVAAIWFLVAALTLLSVVSRRMDPSADPGPGRQRYFYVQQILVVLALAMTVSRMRLGAAVPRSRRLALCGVALVFLAQANVCNYRHFRSCEATGREVSRFVREVDADPNRERRHLLGRGSFTIDLRPVPRAR